MPVFEDHLSVSYLRATRVVIVEPNSGAMIYLSHDLVKRVPQDSKVGSSLNGFDVFHELVRGEALFLMLNLFRLLPASKPVAISLSDREIQYNLSSQCL